MLLPLAWAKMAKNLGRQKKLLAANEVRYMHPWDQVLEGKVWVFDFFCFQRVPMEFSLCSHQVPCEFPKFPIAPHFIHILCHKFYSCNLHKQPKGGDCNISILELFKVGFIFLMGQSKMPITERKKKEL
jgi:hypothetical protein